MWGVRFPLWWLFVQVLIEKMRVSLYTLIKI